MYFVDFLIEIDPNYKYPSTSRRLSVEVALNPPTNFKTSKENREKFGTHFEFVNRDNEVNSLLLFAQESYGNYKADEYQGNMLCVPGSPGML